MVLVSPSIAVETAPARSEQMAKLAADCRLTVFARQALQQDRALASVNVGVTVQANVATLWGPIPSAALARRAEEVLRQVPGIAEVRNELQVELASATVQNMFGPPLKPVVREPLPVPASPTGILAGRPFENKAAEAVPLTPPIVISLRPPLPPDVPAVVPVAAAAAPNVEAAVNQIRSADARFRQVRTEIQDGVVHLRGLVPHGEDMYDLAQRLAKVAGVKRVIVEEVQTPPKRRSLALP
jgi:osmotically-inducible protein OsmY